MRENRTLRLLMKRIYTALWVKKKLHSPQLLLETILYCLVRAVIGFSRENLNFISPYLYTRVLQDDYGAYYLLD